MPDEAVVPSPDASDIGAYCRAVEDHLTRVNGGHLVRIVGPGFALVHQWATDGVPLSIVYHAIEAKAERHKAGASPRPLRIEFCEADVRDAHRKWRRAIGVQPPAPAQEDAGAAAGEDDVESQTRRHPSSASHLERAIDRATRALGRLDWPEALRDAVTRHVAGLTSLRESAKGVRGAARDAADEELWRLDEALTAALRELAPPDTLSDARRAAAEELAPFRTRLSAEAHRAAIDLTTDRLVRDRLGLPSLEIRG